MNFKDSELLVTTLSKLIPGVSIDDEHSLEDAYLFAIQKNTEAFKEQLRLVRKKHSKTQVDVAKFLGITQAAYSSWESGAIIPKVDFIKKLSDFYGDDPSVFLDLIQPDITGITSSVPVFWNSDIESLSCEELYSKIQERRSSNCTNDVIEIDGETYPKSNLFFEVASCEGIDFFYYVSDDAMEPLVSKGCYVAFDIHSIKDVSLEEKLRITNNKIVLLSINNGPVMLRRVLFDGFIVTICDSNHRYPTRAFPINNSGSILKTVNDRLAFSSSKDAIITADAITMYGIGLKAITPL